MNTNFDQVQELAKDLRTQEPRPAYEELGGYPMAARCLDKCRASIVGCQGDYTYGCPLDHQFFEEAGIDVDEFRNFVATGASDEEVAEWIQEHAHA